MKIGLIASIWISIPPKGFGFGAQEYLAYYLAEGLVKKGHDVTLFTTGDAETHAKVVSAAPRQIKDLTPADNKVKDVFELINLSQAYKMADQFDIIHNNLLPYGLIYSDMFKTPTIHTLHHQIYRVSDIYFYKRFKDQNFVSISNAQKKIRPELNYVSTVYNGVDTGFYNFKNNPKADYLIFFGRLKKYKGIHTAIKVAKALGIKLMIASPLPHPSQTDYEEVTAYWTEEIKPSLNSDITHIGEVIGSEKIKLLQNARALIMPVEREEPFGMTVIEAMSCGTPVIAYANGAVPELMLDKVTGYLVPMLPGGENNYFIKSTGVEGMTEAVRTLFALPEKEYDTMRSESRSYIEENFTIQKMVDSYEKIYRKFMIQ